MAASVIFFFIRLQYSNYGDSGRQEKLVIAAIQENSCFVVIFHRFKRGKMQLKKPSLCFYFFLFFLPCVTIILVSINAVLGTHTVHLSAVV